jgi:alpha-glucosidase
MQMPKFNMTHDDMPQVLELFRRYVDAHGEIFTVAEVGAPEPLQVMKDYTHGATRLNTAYSFDFLNAPDLTKSAVVEFLSGWPGEPGEGWPSWAFSNHDAPRVASRWLGDLELPHRVRLVALLQMALRGNLFIYQGEELGLPQVDVPFEKLKDPEGINNWPHTMGRDGARTPMPWQGSGRFGGFSHCEPWLPLGDEHRALAVDAQIDDPDSTLSYFRQLISMRQGKPALRHGEFTFLDAPGEVLAFERSARSERLVCVFNLSGSFDEWSPGNVSVVASAGAEIADPTNGIPPWSGYIAEVRDV